MPIACRVDPQTGLVVEVYDGDVSFDEWYDHIGAMLNDPIWRDTTRSLSDLSTARLTPWSDDELVRMVNLFKTQTLRVAGRRTAVIATPTNTMARDIARHAVDQLGARTIVFNNLTPACIWLSVHEEAVQAALDDLRTTLANGTNA